MDYTDFEKLAEQATQYLRACNERAHRQFGVGSYARYEYDLFKNEIWWSNTGAPKVRGKLTVVGSLSSKSETWLWAWANPHFKDVEIGSIDQVREFGEREGLPKLSESKWKADEVDGWEMTSISARLLEAQGAYCSPSESGGLFLLYDNLEFIPDEEIDRYLPLKREHQNDGGLPLHLDRLHQSNTPNTMPPEPQPISFRCQPSPKVMLLCVLFFGVCAAVLGHQASTNTRGLVLNGILEFSPAGASVLYWVLTGTSVLFVLVAVWGLLTTKIHGVPDIVLTHDSISFPVGFPIKRAYTLPYSQITDLGQSEVSGQRLLMLQTETKKHWIALNWLADKEAELLLSQELAHRIKSSSQENVTG